MIEQADDYLSILFVLSNFVLLASSRLGFCIKAVTAQGVFLAVIPLLREWGHIAATSWILGGVTLLIKGYIFPKLLLSAIERAKIKREIDPMISYNASLLIGIAMLIFGFWLQSRLGIGRDGRALLLPAAFFAIMAGFFITTARRNALTQILGYLALENGIFAFGAAALAAHPWVLEMGVLLDIFVAVFIMGIALFHISREFDHMDAGRLSSLRDSTGEV